MEDEWMYKMENLRAEVAQPDSWLETDGMLGCANHIVSSTEDLIFEGLRAVLARDPYGTTLDASSDDVKHI